MVIGLCVGHDSLFYKYAEALTTTLVTKDRGVTLRQGDKSLTQSEATDVCFRSASESELLAYIATADGNLCDGSAGGTAGDRKSVV